MNKDFDLNSYDYILPQDKIAQFPAEKRDSSRLLVLHTESGHIEDRHFYDIIDYLHPNDLIVVNNTKVFPARLIGRKTSGGKVEIFLLEFPQKKLVSGTCEQKQKIVTAACLIKSSKRPRPGTKLVFHDDLEGEVLELLEGGKAIVSLSYKGNLQEILARHGKIPLPPYIRRGEGGKKSDKDRYQTLYADKTGAVAAPTAGLHFSEELLSKIKDKNVHFAAITLHVGYGTFAPVRKKDIRDHNIHEEYINIPKETAELINKTKAAGGRIWAVGTTTVRALEFAANNEGNVHEKEGWCGLYIYPGFHFKVIDNLITNFHLPKSSLLFLVSALTGREMLLHAYQEAVNSDYKFYSYGDATLILRDK